MERPRDGVDRTAHGRTNSELGSPEVPVDRFEEEIDLGRYLRRFQQDWKLLVAGAVVGSTIGLTISLRRPTLFEASTTVLAQQAGSPAALATSRALLRNFTLAAETIRETGLDKDPYRMTPQTFVERVLTVEELPGTMLLAVKTKLPDAMLAARASQVLSDKAVELNRRVAQEGNTSLRNQLKVLLDDAAARMKAAEQQLLTRRTETQVELLRQDTEAMLEERGELLKLLIDIEAEKSRLAAAEKEIEKLQPVLSVPRAVPAEDALRRASRAVPSVPAANQAPVENRSVVGKASQSPLGKEPPDQRQASRGSETRGAQEVERADPETVNPEFLDLSNPFVNPVYQTLAYQIAVSRTRLAGMERERSEIMGVRNLDGARFTQLTELYKGQIEIENLQNNYDLAKRVFSDLSVRYEQSRTESVGAMVQLQLVDRAIPPERPMPRKRVESTVVGLAAGVLIAALLALAVNREHAGAGELPGRSS